MATQAPKTRLSFSPSILQYHKPRTADRPFYKRQSSPRKFFPSQEVKESLNASWLRRTDPLMPLYPYGKNITFPAANEGLYGGSTIQSGHKISQGKNKGKTLRKWHPNVRAETLRSEALNREMTIPVTARVMKTIKKCGGLDQYVMGEKPARIKELGLLGWKLRWLVMNSPSMKTKLAHERQQLGLPAEPSQNSSFEQVWADPEKREALTQKLDQTWEQLREKDERFRKHIKETLRWKTKIPEMVTLQNHKPSSIA